MAITIDGKTYRNQQEQIYKNMEDIQELQNIIKPEYTTAEALTSSSTSVAIADTNAPSGTKSGWLLTQDGLKFKINGGDDTNLLLEFYANLKGPQGEDGAAVNIDDTGTSLTKVWSSSKTNAYVNSKINNNAESDNTTWSSNKIKTLISSGVAWTTTDKDGDSQMALSDIYLGGNAASILQPSGPNLKVSDLVVFVDGDLKAKTLYRVASIVGSTVTVAKVCDFGGGSQKYRHSIKCTDNTNKKWVGITIINSSPDDINTLAKLKNSIDGDTYGDIDHLYTEVNGGFYYSGTYNAIGLYKMTSYPFDLYIVGRKIASTSDELGSSFATEDGTDIKYEDVVENW